MVENRKHARIVVSVAVDFTSEHNFFSGSTRDMSAGGLFIESDVALNVGAKIGISLHLLEKSYLIQGEVAWVLIDETGASRGFGVRFLDLHATTRRAIEAFMALRSPTKLVGSAPDAPLARRVSPPILPVRTPPRPRPIPSR